MRLDHLELSIYYSIIPWWVSSRSMYEREWQIFLSETPESQIIKREKGETKSGGTLKITCAIHLIAIPG